MKWLRRLFHGDYSKDEFAIWADRRLDHIDKHPLSLEDANDGRLMVNPGHGWEQLDRHIDVDQTLQELLASGANEDISFRPVRNDYAALTFSCNPRVRKNLRLFGQMKFELLQGRIGVLEIECWSDKQVHLRDVDVHYLCVRQANPPRDPVEWVTLENCRVGTLAIDSGCVRNFSARNSRVLNFEVPNPDAVNPFCGSVVFEHVEMPRTSKDVPLTGAQPYRNMRSHLNALQDGVGASSFHALEQVLELETETSAANKFFGYVYWVASNFGTSTVQPLMWLFGLSLLSVAVLGVADGAVVLGDCEKPVGWYATLCGEDGWASLARGFVMGFQPISFLGALLRTGSGYSLIAANVWVQAWLVFQGLMSGVLLTLFILALRRRFKLGP